MCAEGMGCETWRVICVFLGTMKDFTDGSLTKPFIPKWDSTVVKIVLAMAGMTSLLVELIGLTA